MLDQIIALYQQFKTMDIMMQVMVIAGALVIILKFLIAVCLLIPGPQPEKLLQAVVDKLEAMSRK